MLIRLMVFITIISSYSLANSGVKYNQSIGVEVFAISQSLSLSEDKFLFYNNTNTTYSHYTYKYLKDTLYNNINTYNTYNTYNTNIYAGWIIQNNPTIELFDNKWFSYISKYQGLSKIIVTINTKYHDIFERLYKLQQARQKLERKFSEYKTDGINYSKYLNEIDSDIRLLSAHGMKLANVSKKLFRTIKPIIIDAEMRMDTLSARQDSMQGLRSFEKEMNRVSKLPQGAIDDSIDEIVDSIDIAISKLEKALAK